MTLPLRLHSRSSRPGSGVSRTACSSSWPRVASILCLLIVGVALLAGCGSSPKAPTPAPTPTPQYNSGNWEFTFKVVTSNWQPGEIVPMGAYLSDLQGVETGTAAVQLAFPQICNAQCCSGPFAQFNNALSGTLTSADVLNLASSVPDGGPAFTMNGMMSGETFSDGSFNLTGSCTAAGTVTGVEIATLNGSYAGTLTSQDTGKSYSFSTTLAQSSALSTRGLFPVTGTGTLTAYPCMTTVTVPTPVANYSGMLGDEFNLAMTGANGAQFDLSGTLSADGETITVTYSAIGGSCANDIGSGTLTLQ